MKTRKGVVKIVVTLILILVIIILTLVFITPRAYDADARAKRVLMPCDCPSSGKVRIKALGGYQIYLSEDDKPLGNSVLQFCNCKEEEIEEKNLRFNLRIFMKKYGTLVEAKLRLPDKFRGLKFKPNDGGWVAIGEMVVTEIIGESVPEGVLTLDSVNHPMKSQIPRVSREEQGVQPESNSVSAPVASIPVAILPYSDSDRTGLMSGGAGFVKFESVYLENPEANTMWSFEYLCLGDSCDDMIPACTHTYILDADSNTELVQGCLLNIDLDKDPLYVEAQSKNPDKNTEDRWFCREGCPASLSHCILRRCLPQDISISQDYQRWWYCTIPNAAPEGTDCGFENAACVKEGDGLPSCKVGDATIPADCNVADETMCPGAEPDGDTYGWCCPTYKCSQTGTGFLGLSTTTCTIHGPVFLDSFEEIAEVVCPIGDDYECPMPPERCVEMSADKSNYNANCAITLPAGPVTQCEPNSLGGARPCACGSAFSKYYTMNVHSELELHSEPQTCLSGQACCSYGAGSFYLCRTLKSGMCPPESELELDFCIPNKVPGDTDPVKTGIGCWCGLHLCGGTIEDEVCCPDRVSGNAYCAPADSGCPDD